jgi:lysophospholipase L1-like esterase
LGDSFIEGFGVQNDSLTFPERLRKCLQNGKKKISVINAGICGSNPVYEISLYNKLLRDYNNDLVILQVNLSDLQDIEYTYHRKKMPVNEYFNASSHLFRIFHADILGYNFTTEESSRYIRLRRKEILQSLTQQLKEFESNLSKENRKLVLVYLPLIGEIYIKDKDKEDAFTNELEHSLEISGIPLVNLKKEYLKKFDGNNKIIKQYYWTKDKHHNPRGYKLMAEIVSERLKAIDVVK